jgi:SlyX protein
VSGDGQILERLQELESQLAFQDELHTQLNDIVARQDREISELKDQVKALSARLRDLGDAMPGQSDPASEAPPHY